MSHEILPGIKQFDLTGKSAIITGGSRGLGYAMAAGLASAGARSDACKQECRRREKLRLNNWKQILEQK